MTTPVLSAQRDHARGRVYDVRVSERMVSVFLTFHALERIERWRLTERQVLRALLLPEEVLRGHRERFIAHRRQGTRVVRVVYEYDQHLPAVLTVYCPTVKRYFRGGGHYEDRILA